MHVAIIMDGNGRWAKERGKPRLAGHRAGAESVRECVEGCKQLGVEYLTLYAFSSENWNRPAAEVTALMMLLERFLEEKAEELMKQQTFSLLLLDLNLPDGSAIELLDRVQQSDAPPIPTVILSAESPSHDVEGRVNAVMLKTRVSEAHVVQTILDVLKRPPEAA